jgi:hypothetical protein
VALAQRPAVRQLNLPPMATPHFLRPLVLVTLANYLALVPYYVHNDASAQHPLPGLRALFLVSLTLAWFLSGVRRVTRHSRFGRPVLLSFLLTEAALYAKTFATGAVVHQMHNPSDLVRTVFLIGYLSGAVALVYVVLLARDGGRGAPERGEETTRDDRKRADGKSPGARRSVFEPVAG